MNDLKRKAIFGVFWQLSQKMSSQMIGLIVSIALARILSPTDFGIVAMTSIFINVAAVFATSGLGSSLIQKKDVDELDCNTVFWAGLVLSIIIYIILYFSAPLIANIYNNKQLISIVRILGIWLFFSSIMSVQNSLISRKLDFKLFFYRSLISTILSGSIGLTMALTGFGVWAIVAHQMSNTIIGIIAMWFIVKWRPRWQFSMERLKKLLSFGLNLTGANLFGTFFNELRNFLIGIKYLPSDLAFSNRGSSIPRILDNNIRGTISSVLFPAMSRLQDNHENVKTSIRRSMMVSTFIIAPIMILMSATSDKIILLVYTAKWAQAIPFMQVVCFQYLFSIIGDSNLQAINAIGRSDITFKLEFIKKPILLLILLYTMTISPLAMTIGCTFYSLIAGAINAYPNKKLIGYGYIEQMKDVFPQIAISIIMGGVVYLIGMCNINNILILIIQLCVGVSFYALFTKWLNLNSMKYLLSTIKEMKR